MENMPQNSDGKKSIWPVILIIVIIAVGVLAFLLMNKMNEKTASETENNSQAQEQTQPQNTNILETNEINEENIDSDMPTANNETENMNKNITVTSNNFVFDVNEIKVKKGDTVNLTFINAEGLHDWVLDEFNANTGKLSAGETVTITFVADKTGTFEYYCSVGSHRQMGMKGNLIVE